ncbi:prolyl oligopeptidase [Pholiota conissans]|uniref:Prolyl endopeptidase n=1 Tax=Pholiota conissans TaxID=109636 RepID=A0A9P5YVJ9_9AGAR|nr:prolyl oligopeptidase [Pholiota conissans]
MFPQLRRNLPLRHTSRIVLRLSGYRSAQFSSMPLPTTWIPGSYPPARRGNYVDTYKSAKRGKVNVRDPYQHFEENCPETEEFSALQAKCTRSYLDQNPNLTRLLDAFESCNDYAKFYAPQLRDDGRYYWFYNSGLDAQTAFYRSWDTSLPDITNIDDSGGEMFFDPNALSEDGTAALATYAFSPCAKYFAYGVSISGSDFISVFIRRTAVPFTSDVNPNNDSGRLPEEIKFVKFSAIAWTPDSNGFFYQRYPDNSASIQENGTIATEGDVDAMVYYHRIGTPQSEDVLVFQDKENPERMFHVEVSDDKKYIFLYVLKDSSRQNLLWVADFDPAKIGPDIKWNKVIEEWGAEYDAITTKGPLLYLRTNHKAPQYKVITVDVSNNNEIKELIPESDAYMSSILSVNRDYFAVVYKRNVKDELYLYTHTGEELTRLAEDFVGAVSVSGREKQTFFFVSLTGFTSPGTLARYDFTAPEDKRWSIYRHIKLTGLNTEDFEATQVWYKSKDGTPIPMFIVRHKSTKLDGTAAALQYGYGGFSISIDPFFSSTILTFIQKYGMILAVPSIRGGGEFGEDWHLAGCREKKTNCFDDFIAATEFLVKNKYAAQGKVIINGGSNGGLLVAACVNRAPEGTFGCAIAEVGVHDLLKFHKFTIGRAWISDYGDPDVPEDFDFIYPMSPLHNIPRKKILPPTLLLTADHDDRVVPMHSFKFAAELQHSHRLNPHPLLLRVDLNAGHGAGKSTQQKLMEHADKWGFAAQSLGLEWKECQKLSKP